jgi:hypothetical protein
MDDNILETVQLEQQARALSEAQVSQRGVSSASLSAQDTVSGALSWGCCSLLARSTRATECRQFPTRLSRH